MMAVVVRGEERVERADPGTGCSVKVAVIVSSTHSLSVR